MTDTRITETEVLVVGGGIVGVCTALYLARQGVEVTLVEKGSLAAGGSYGNAGLLVPSHAVPLAEPAAIRHGLRWMLNPDSPFYIKPRLDLDLVRWLWRFRQASTAARVAAAIPVLRDLHLASLDLYRTLHEEGLDLGFGQRGRLLLCASEAGFAAACHEAEQMAAAGITTKRLDRDGCRDQLDGLACDVVGGIHYEQDGHLDPLRTVSAIAEAAASAGATILTDTETLVWNTVGDHIDTVETSAGVFHAQQIVVATGSWTPALTRDLRLAVPIQPAKGYSVTIEAPLDMPATPFMLTEAKVGVTPMVHGDRRRLRFAGTLELAGMDLSINQRRVKALTAAVPRYVPGWNPDHFVVEEVWGGLRPCTPDGLPLLGRPRRWRNLTLAAGHAMIGISLGAVTGRLAADLARQAAIDTDLGLLDPDRFG